MIYQYFWRLTQTIRNAILSVLYYNITKLFNWYESGRGSNESGEVMHPIKTPLPLLSETILILIYNFYFIFPNISWHFFVSYLRQVLDVSYVRLPHLWNRVSDYLLFFFCFFASLSNHLSFITLAFPLCDWST